MQAEEWQTPPDEADVPIEKYIWRTSTNTASDEGVGAIVAVLEFGDRTVYTPVTKRQFDSLRGADAETFSELFNTIVETAANHTIGELSGGRALDDLVNADSLDDFERKVFYLSRDVEQEYKEFLEQMHEDDASVANAKLFCMRPPF